MSREITMELFAEQIRVVKENITNQMNIVKTAYSHVKNNMNELSLFEQFIDDESHDNNSIKNKISTYVVLKNRLKSEYRNFKMNLSNIFSIERRLSGPPVTNEEAREIERVLIHYSYNNNNFINRRMVDSIIDDYFTFKNNPDNYRGVVDNVKKALDMIEKELNNEKIKYGVYPDVFEDLEEVLKKVRVNEFELKGHLGAENPSNNFNFYKKIFDNLKRARDVMNEGERRVNKTAELNKEYCEESKKNPKDPDDKLGIVSLDYEITKELEEKFPWIKGEYIEANGDWHAPIEKKEQGQGQGQGQGVLNR